MLYAAFIALLAPVCLSQSNPQISLDTSETLFTVLAAINSCGFDAELDASEPLRSQVRQQVAAAVEASQEAKDVKQAMCDFYTAHQLPDPSRTLAQYISLALYLSPPPALAPKVKDADLAPDAAVLTGILQPLQKFYELAGLHAIWERNQAVYDQLMARYHEPLAKILFDTEIYLKLPSAGYLGRGFTVYVDAMGAPGQVNARNYGSDYYVVIAPGKGSGLKTDQIRHAYLHYLLDPLALKYPEALKRLQPLLETVKNAPMDPNFKTDAALLVTECMIRAVEARTTGSSKTPEAQRLQAVDDSEKQGFVLTEYFYQALLGFEKSPAGLRNVYGEMLNNIDVRKEQRQAQEVHFASTAAPEVLHLTSPEQGKLLLTAAERLSAGDPQAAQKLAQQALDEKKEDPGRALFILAQVATANRDIQGARSYFQQALEVAHEPRVLAWSHIYLGRIFDLQENREAALDQYRAALTTGSELPEAKAAAERGIQKPYEPPRRPQQPEQ